MPRPPIHSHYSYECRVPTKSVPKTWSNARRAGIQGYFCVQTELSFAQYRKYRTLPLRKTPLVSKMNGLVTRSTRGSEMSISHENMISLENVRHSALLRQASGYIELAEFNMTPDQEISKPAQKLLLNAIQLLDRLSETERSNGNAIVLRAEALRTLGQFSDALPYFQRAVANTPQSVTSWLGFGWCLKRLGKLQEAITVLTQGIDICGDDPILAYNLSCYHSLAGNVPAAIEYLTKAITSDDRFRSLTSCESDFDPIRNDPRFVAVIGQPV